MGSACLLSAEDGIIFSGDTLFAGGWGRVDLPGGDAEAMVESLARLARLEDSLRVVPGTGRETTIARERPLLELIAREGRLAGLGLLAAHPHVRVDRPTTHADLAALIVPAPPAWPWPGRRRHVPITVHRRARPGGRGHPAPPPGGAPRGSAFCQLATRSAGRAPLTTAASTAQPGCRSWVQSLNRQPAAVVSTSRKAAARPAPSSQRASSRIPGVSRRRPPPGSGTSCRRWSCGGPGRRRRGPRTSQVAARRGSR